MAVGEDSRIVALHARLDERRARLIIDALLRSVLAKDKVEGECAVLAHHQLPLRRVHLQAQALLLELLLGDHGTHAHGDLDVVVGAFILGWHGRSTREEDLPPRTLAGGPSLRAFRCFTGWQPFCSRREDVGYTVKACSSKTAELASVLLGRSLASCSARPARPPAAPSPQVTMSGNSLMFTDSVICFKELIDKEETAKRQWRGKYGMNKEGWRPVEPFERTGASAQQPASLMLNSVMARRPASRALTAHASLFLFRRQLQGGAAKRHAQRRAP